MVSALPLCLLILAVVVVSSQDISSESDYLEETPLSERRTFKHKKPLKVFPLIKKRKKFGGWLPSVFGKTEYAEVPVYQEVPVRPLYKFHRYQGIEVKPVADAHGVSGPETFADAHSVVGSSHYAPAFPADHSSDYAPAFGFDHYAFPPAPPSSFLLHPVNDKPVFSGPLFPSPFFSSIPKSVFSFDQAPSLHPPLFSSVPISLPPAPVFSTVSIAKPAPTQIISTPTLPAISTPFPPSFALPLPLPAPAPAFSFPVKFPAPAWPAPSPAPVFSSVSVIPPPSAPIFSPLPSPSPAPAPSSLSASPEPEYPYPPSGSPIPSYVKDISLPEISVTPTPTPSSVAVVTPHYEEVTSSVSDDTKTLDHGLLQKLKDWKAEKANAALSHFAHFKPKPAPVLTSPHHPTLQFPSPVHPLPLTPDFRPHGLFFPQSAPFFSHPKYENFPPNNALTPPLFNSYGAPIPHDSYSAIHSSHDRVSPDASEDNPSVLPAPPAFAGPKPQPSPVDPAIKQPETQTRTQIVQGFQPQNFQPQSLLPQEQPIYVPEENKTIKEEVKAIEEVVHPVRNSQPEGIEEPEEPNLQHQNEQTNS